MSSRISKPKSRKSIDSTEKSTSARRRDTLFAYIDSCGFDVMPCSFCSGRGLRCRMVERSSKCGECVRRGRTCDASGVAVSSREFVVWFGFLRVFLMSVFVVGRIISESKRLNKEEESAEELLASRRAALRQAQADLDESLNRLERLRKQKRQLISKGNEMARLGLQSLDELEAEERKESDAVIEVQSLGGVDLIDWNAVAGDANFSMDELLSVEGSSL